MKQQKEEPSGSSFLFQTMINFDSDRQARNRDSWSRYWAKSPAHSLHGTFDADYGPAISGFWKNVCSHVAAGSSVLDIATGNGALPRMMLNWRNDLRIDAIDAADVAIHWQIPQGGARPTFHSRVECEALPFHDNSFDLVTSQYGIEYSDLDRSLAEIARTLREGGMFAAIMHSADSTITSVTGEELGHVKLLLAEGGAMETLMAIIPLLSIAATAAGREQLDADAGARTIRERFNTAMGEVQASMVRASVPDILVEFLQWAPQVLAIASQRASPDDALRHCLEYKQQLEDAGERYRALLDATLDAGKQQHLINELAGLGFRTMGFNALEHDGRCLGIALTATLGLDGGADLARKM